MLGPFDQPKTPEVKKVLNDKKVSDHHAIIPTVELAEFDFSKLREWEQKILFLIAVHTVEAMEEDHVFMETEVEVRCQDEIFKAKGKVVKQIGWKLFEECFKNEDGLAIENPADAGKDRIPKVEADHKFYNVSAAKTEHFTAPPKQEKLIAAVEAAGYRFAKEESNSQHLQFIPDGTHRMQGHLFAKSWNEVERWVEAIIEKGDPIQKERVERVIYPERFEQSFEEMMFTRKECRLSIYHLDENGSGRDQLFVGMEDLQKKGIMVTADQYRCVYSSLYLPNEDMNAIYSIFNDDPPADYKAHSLSVSDVVIMNQNGDMKAYFVDRFGFQELTDFVEERKKILGMENDIQKRDILEQTSCISFYAAECSEFPVLGEVHHDLNLPDALEAYEKIPAERMNGLKSVGFNLQEGSDYDGMMDLMVAGRSQREILDSIPFYKENKLVQEALKRVEQYIEEKSLNVEKTRPKEEKGEIQKTKSQKRREDMSL